jgi:hypothetical protein
MKRALLTTALLLSGCANAKATAATLVAASDLAADELATGWEAGTDAQIDHCRAKLGGDSTPDQRAECLGVFHPDNTAKVIDGVEILVAAQLKAKEAAECEDLAVCAEEADWKAIADQLYQAWMTVRPFAKALKESKK